MDLKVTVGIDRQRARGSLAAPVGVKDDDFWRRLTTHFISASFDRPLAAPAGGQKWQHCRFPASLSIQRQQLAQFLITISSHNF